MTDTNTRALDQGLSAAFEATDPSTGEVLKFEGRQLALPGRAHSVGLELSGHLTYDQWRDVGEALQSVNRSVMWWIGDWLRYGEQRWGEMYAQAIDDTGRAYDALRNAKRVADVFAQTDRRRSDLSWSHHLEVAALDQKMADDLLGKAVKEGMSTRELRLEAQKIKNAQALGASVANDSTCTAADIWKLAESGVRYGTVYADPPWLYSNQGTRASTGNHYNGMTVEQLCELPIARLAADNAHLHLWTTNGFLFECPKIFEAWGFEFRSSLVWVKPQMGIGNYWRNSHEFLLTAIRGNAKRFNDKSLMSWINCDRSKHSAKPERVRQYIERASPGPYLEMFGRSPATGWTVWGNQIERGMFFADVPEVA